MLDRIGAREATRETFEREHGPFLSSRKGRGSRSPRSRRGSPRTIAQHFDERLFR